MLRSAFDRETKNTQIRIRKQSLPVKMLLLVMYLDSISRAWQVRSWSNLNHQDCFFICSPSTPFIKPGQYFEVQTFVHNCLCTAIPLPPRLALNSWVHTNFLPPKQLGLQACAPVPGFYFCILIASAGHLKDHVYFDLQKLSPVLSSVPYILHRVHDSLHDVKAFVFILK